MTVMSATMFWFSMRLGRGVVWFSVFFAWIGVMVMVRRRVMMLKIIVFCNMFFIFITPMVYNILLLYKYFDIFER